MRRALDDRKTGLRRRAPRPFGRSLPIPAFCPSVFGIRRPAPYLEGMRPTQNIVRTVILTLSLGLSMGLSPAMADERDHAWIPAEISLPDDMEVVIDRSIGSANRMLSFTTDEEVDVLADRWRAALEDGPYQVKPAAEGMDKRMIEFSGGDVRNGQITFLPGADSTRTTVQFDASIND